MFEGFPEMFHGVSGVSGALCVVCRNISIESGGFRAFQVISGVSWGVRDVRTPLGIPLKGS